MPLPPAWRFVAELSTSFFLQFGPGVAFALLARPARPHLFALICVVVGPSIVTLAATVAALLGGPDLRTVWVGLAVLTLAVLVPGGVAEFVSLRRSGHRPERVGGRRVLVDSPTAQPRRLPVPLILTLLGLTVALATAAANRGDPQPGGAALTAGPLWFVGAGLTLVGTILAWHRGASLAVPVLSLSSIVVASQALMYREPTAVVAARHIGLVDYILVNGRLDRTTDIYQAWAGMFASAALNVRAAGITDLFGYAAWWGVVAAPVMVLAVRCLAGAFLDDRRSWAAGLLFGLGSSLNTSFFAPQVLGFTMALAAVALLALPPDRAGGLSLRLRILTAAVISVPLALTHQISPYMMTLALVALAVFGLVRPWWVFIIPAAPAVAWALVNQHLLGTYVSTSAFGQLFDNLAPPENSVGAFPLPLANRVTFLLPAAVLVIIGLVALLVLVRLRTRLAWGLAVTAGSPVVLMAGTSYGQEGIFRVALFALPWLAILACLPVSLPRARVVPRRVRGVAAALGLTALLSVNIVGLTGMDWARVIRSEDVSAARWVEQTAPPGSLILSLGTDLTMPDDSTARYQETGWLSRTSLITPPDNPYPTTTGAAYDASADLADLTKRFTKLRASRHYVVASDSAGAYDQRYGNQRYTDHQKLSQAVAVSPLWRAVHRGQGVTVYEFREVAR